MPDTIIATKLHLPQLHHGLVPRPHLTARLNAGLTARFKLTLISAAAGFGKTTLLSQWLARYDRKKIAWLTLDESDSDPVHFLSYFISALQTSVPGLGEAVLAALQAPQPPPIDRLLPSLLNEIAALQQQLILILDDYHTLNAPDIDAALSFIIKNQPVQLHLVVATREDPSLPLSRLRSRRQLTELRAADLRFTPVETTDFLNRVMQLDLSKADVNALEDRTEGWIAGLQLAALAIQGEEDTAGFIRSFTGSHRFILDYLVEEVLQRQSPETREFLLRTSILDRLCGPLCDFILEYPPGSSQAVLETLERANMFLVPLDGERRWYRYHHLFGELLHKRLTSLTPAEIPEHSETARSLSALHQRASKWHESSSLLFEAFHHAAAANDIDRAEKLLDRDGVGLYLRSVSLPVLDWLNSLSDEVLDARPRLRVRAATLALMAGKTSGVEEHLEAAENASQHMELDEPTRDLVGQIACARATLALTRYQPALMIVQARRALEYLLPHNLTFRFTATWALATASLMQGDRVTAAQAFRQGLDISQQAGDMFSIILATSDLGRIQELENELYRAAENYRCAIELAGAHPQPNIGEIHLGLARILYEWNDLETASYHVTQSLRLLQQYDRMIDRFILAEAFQVQVTLAQGDLSAANSLLENLESAVREPHFSHRAPDVAAVRILSLLKQNLFEAAAEQAAMHPLELLQARVHLARGDASKALAIVEPLRHQMESRCWRDEQLKAMALQSAAAFAGGDSNSAFHLLAETLALAQPGGFIRLFVDLGKPMQQLLADYRNLKAAQYTAVYQDYIGKLLTAFSKTANTCHEHHRDPGEPNLTPRETEILQLIAQGLSNHDISEQLFLALDTVKGHNRRIFNKLQVHRRTEAVARARDLGLLD